MTKENLESNLGKSIFKYMALGILISNSFSGYFASQKLNNGWDQEKIEKNVEERCYDRLGPMGGICYKGTSIGREIIYSIKG